MCYAGARRQSLWQAACSGRHSGAGWAVALRGWHECAAIRAAIRARATAAAQHLRMRRAAVLMDSWQRAAAEGRRDRAANVAAAGLAARRCLRRSLQPWAHLARDDRRLRCCAHAEMTARMLIMRCGRVDRRNCVCAGLLGCCASCHVTYLCICAQDHRGSHHSTEDKERHETRAAQLAKPVQGVASRSLLCRIAASAAQPHRAGK